MSDEIRTEKGDFVAEIILDRPSKMNAITPAMAAAIEHHCREFDRDDSVRVVLLRGAGDRAFCAGSDLNALAEYPTPWKFRNRVEYATAVRNVRKPVVAALHGWVLGGGAEMALSADIRVMGRSARLGFPEVRRGWVGGGGAISVWRTDARDGRRSLLVRQSHRGLTSGRPTWRTPKVRGTGTPAGLQRSTLPKVLA